MFDIEKFIDIDYLTEDRKGRKKKTQEVFTPYCIVKKLMDNISREDWADPDKTFLDPAGGNGNIVLGILYRRIHEYNIPWRKALENMYTCELMEDNVQESRQRVHELLRNIAPDYSPRIANRIMNKNFVCHDFFTWDFENWCEKKEEKKIKKK